MIGVQPGAENPDSESEVDSDFQFRFRFRCLDLIEGPTRAVAAGLGSKVLTVAGVLSWTSIPCSDSDSRLKWRAESSAWPRAEPSPLRAASRSPARTVAGVASRIGLSYSDGDDTMQIRFRLRFLDLMEG